MTTTSRQPKGIRSGGQFSSTARAEAGITLGTDPMAGIQELIGPGNLRDRHRAWTIAAIKKFLGEPDKLVNNPVYRTAPKMRMFLVSRVEEVEATDEWKAWQEANCRRSSASTSRKEGKDAVVLVGHGRTGPYPVVRR